jgi:hypothetical protein
MGLAQLDQLMATNPLQKFLGTYQFGTYNQSQPNKEFTVICIEDLWQEEVKGVDSSDEESNTDKTMITSTESRATIQRHTNQSTTATNWQPRSTTNTKHCG